MSIIQKPASTKIILLELDIGQEWDFWVSYDIGTYKVNFEGIYAEITSFTGGYETAEITRIGSVKVDGLAMSPVQSAAAAVSNDSSFYYHDSSKTLYLHGPDGERPSIDLVVIGEAIGISNHASSLNRWSVYNGFPYAPRLLAIPSVGKSKDPLFFGRVSFEGGTVRINNADGWFDLFGEEQDLYGNAARILLGFDDQEYSEFIPIFAGFIDQVEVGPREVAVRIQDKREQLSRKLPPNAFDQTTYADLKDGNVGKGIPLGYGVMRNVPVICTNEEETPAPANYSFKLFDVSDHSEGIYAITEVRVDGTAVTPSSTSVANATFELAAADYSPGDKVTCDCTGFKGADGNPIQNALEVLRDLLTTYYPVNFNANFFDLARWETSDTPNIGLFIGKNRPLIDVIEEICATVQGTFLITDDGRYAHRLFNPFAPSLQTIAKEELLEGPPTVAYDPTEVLTSTRVGYSRDWAAGDDEEDHYILEDRSQEEAVLRKFKTYRSKFFPTLLVDSTAAQAFSGNVMALSADVKKTFPARVKTQAVQRFLGDTITVELARASGEYIGNVLAEIIGIEKDISGPQVSVGLECRLVERVAETVYVQGIYYGDSYYGDGYYSKTNNEEVA